MFGLLLNIGIPLVGGWLGKKAGKSKKVLGDKPAQKALGPLGAFAAAAVTAAITGEVDTSRAMVEASAQYGGAAIAIHSVGKNLYQLLRS